MLKQERQKFIIDQVYLHNRVLLVDLADQLQVSVDTIRRDVKELDLEKKIKKVHGGATSYGFLSFNSENKNIYLLEKKIQIAAKAVALIKEGNIILMSGGTTNLEVVKRIPKKIKLTIFTPSLHIAMQLMDFPNIEVIFLGGLLLHEAKFAVGGSVVQSLSQIRVDLCLLGTGYLHPGKGLTEFDWEVVQVKRAMIQASKKTILLSVSDKLHSIQRFQTCELDAVDTLITELHPGDPLLGDFRKGTLQII